MSTKRLSKVALIADLRRTAAARQMTRLDLARLLGRCANSVPSARSGYPSRSCSWDALVQWFDKLGIEVRYELRAKVGLDEAAAPEHRSAPP